MSKKRRRKRNPVLERKYDEGFNDGVERATMFFKEKFEDLKSVKGIGPRTYERVKAQLGEEYFK